MGTTVVIATHNLIRAGRGVDRVRWQCLSWARQFAKIPEVIVVDGSRAAEHTMLARVLPPFVKVIWRYQPEGLNLCKLWNIGIAEAKGEYIQISGADFVFEPNYLKLVETIRAPGRFIMAHTLDCRKTSRRLGDHSVLRWEWPKARPNRWGNLANGIQHATREFFTQHPFDESMERLGAQDNLMYYKARAAGLECGWLAHGPVLHLWHKPSNYKVDEAFEANQKILRAFIDAHALEPDLRASEVFVGPAVNSPQTLNP